LNQLLSAPIHATVSTITVQFHAKSDARFSGGLSASIVYEYLNGATALNSSLKWPTGCFGPDVVFGCVVLSISGSLTDGTSGGAEQFIAGPGSFNGTDFYKAFQDKGYNVVYDNTGLQAVGNDKKTLGIFSSKPCVYRHEPFTDML
jgi:alkaline phosphatase